MRSKSTKPVEKFLEQRYNFDLLSHRIHDHSMNASLQTTDITKSPINIIISIGFKTINVALKNVIQLNVV